MLVAFGESSIRSVEELADRATDDLDGWSERKNGKNIGHAAILNGVEISRKQYESIINSACIRARWIKESA